MQTQKKQTKQIKQTVPADLTIQVTIPGKAVGLFNAVVALHKTKPRGRWIKIEGVGREVLTDYLPDEKEIYTRAILAWLGSEETAELIDESTNLILQGY